MMSKNAENDELLYHVQFTQFYLINVCLFYEHKCTFEKINKSGGGGGGRLFGCSVHIYVFQAHQLLLSPENADKLLKFLHDF